MPEDITAMFLESLEQKDKEELAQLSTAKVEKKKQYGELYYLVPKNQNKPDGELKVNVSLLAIYLKEKYRLKVYNGQLRVLKNNYYQLIDNPKQFIGSQIPEIYRVPKNIEDCEKLINYDGDLILKDKDLAPEKYIAFKNGILDTETYAFIGHYEPEAESLIFINQVDYNWNPFALPDQKTDDFFNSVTNGNQEDIDFLYQVLGVVMSNYRDFKNIFFINGVKDSAKSQFIHLCELLLTNSDGEKDYSSIALKTFTDETSMELIGIVGKRANICGETPPLKISNDVLLKQLSGGDTVTLQRKFMDSIAFVNKAMLIFSGNAVPQFFVSDKSSIGERMLIYNFKTAIPQEKQIPNVYKTLNMEYIIVKAVEQLVKFVNNRQHFTIPSEIHRNREEMERESDSIYRFYKDCVVITDDDRHRVSCTDFYNYYLTYLVDDGVLPETWDHKPDTSRFKMTKRTFVIKIKDLVGEGRYKRSVTYWDGNIENCFDGIQIKNVHVVVDLHKSGFTLIK
jgi:P4 family phage/plasmid primase-like protien